MINYRMRTLGLVMMALMLASISDGYPNVQRWFMIGLVLVWPHVLFQIARRASSGYHAETFNILADNFLAGLLIVALEFRIFPAAGVVLLIVTLNTVLFGGWRLQMRGIGLMAAGLLAGSLLLGFRVHPETEPLLTAISCLTIYIYALFIGATTFPEDT